MAANSNAPIILDVGKASRRQIRELAQGCGKLAGDVQDAVAEVTATLGDDNGGDEQRQLVPVVLVYRKKQRKKRRARGGGRGGSFFPWF